jgi:hypothetical protein
MGRRYANVVVSCLSDAIKKRDVISDNELEEMVGMEYIKNAVSDLEKLQIYK